MNTYAAHCMMWLARTCMAPPLRVHEALVSAAESCSYTLEEMEL